MNKQIETLLGQALDSEVPETWTTLTPEQFTKVSEKFAELIVRQILDITDAHTEVFQTDRDKALIEHIKQSVKQHFGVEQ